MAKVNFKFHPFFALYVFLCIYFGWFNKIFYYVVTAVLHEFGHYAVAKRYGYEVKNIVFSLYGLGIDSRTAYKRSEDIIISLAGPIVNLILVIVLMCLWWIIPTLYLFTYDFVICNIVVMIFNLVPIYPLDGGRILVDLLSIKFSREKILKIIRKVSLVLGMIFIILFIISILMQINLNLLFIGIFFITNSIMHSNEKYYNYIDSFNKNYEKPVEIKIFKVNNLNKANLIKYLSPKYYSIFQLNKNDKVVQVEENDLIK